LSKFRRSDNLRAWTAKGSCPRRSHATRGAPRLWFFVTIIILVMEISATPITKLEAAHRQLRQAVRLFFKNGDMLAVHTLTAAAFQLFSDIGRLSGVVSRFRSDQLIRSEPLKDWITALSSTQNFLEDADKDPDAVHTCSDESTIMFIS